MMTHRTSLRRKVLLAAALCALIVARQSGTGCAGLQTPAEPNIALQSVGTLAASYRQVPFVSLDTPGHAIGLAIDTQALSTILTVDAESFRLPAQFLPLKVLRGVSDRLVVVGRRMLLGQLEIFEIDLRQRTARSIALPDELRDERLFRQAAVIGNDIVLILYHVNDHFSLFVNRLVTGEDGRYRFDQSYLRSVAFKGRYEISTPVFTAARNNKLFICGEGFCYTYCTLQAPCAGGDLGLVDLGIGKRRIIEVASDPAHGIFGLYQDTDGTDPDKPPTFRIIDLESTETAPHAFSGVPWGLRISDGEPVLREITRDQDLVDVFLADVVTADASGLLNLGENNIEGRIAWSQVYYINAFIDLLEFADRGRLPAFARIRRDLQQRLDIEMALWDRLLDGSYPNLLSRRYTTARQPVLHAVQTGRILRAMKRYLRLPNAQPMRNFERFKRDVEELTGHVEAVRVAEDGDRWLPKGRRYLWWPRGTPIPTFDGVGIPFNHMDDWAGGVLYGQSVSARPQAFALTARDCLQILLDFEFRTGFPARFAWSYWWGQVENGWTRAEGVSENVPEYKGEKADAHVSYLTIDMMALLSAGHVYPELLQPGILDYLQTAIERDKLYLFLSEDLEAYGRHPRISAALASKYVRPDAASGLQNAAFAYRALTEQLRKGQP